MKKLVRKLFTPLVTIALAFGVGISLSQQKAELGVKAADVEQEIYSTGFESSDGFTATTVYNNSTVAYSGPSGKEWGTYYGTPSTTSPLSGGQSMQMRWYTNSTSNLGYTFTDFDLQRATKVTFNAKNTTGINALVSYSTDSGLTWLGDETFSLGTAAAGYTYNISATGAFANVRIRFMITFSAAPSSTSRLYIDDVKVFGMVTTTTPNVTITTAEQALEVGETYTYEASVVNAPDAVVTWTINNTDIATINAVSGLVTAVAPGEATITATITVSGIDYTGTGTVKVLFSEPAQVPATLAEIIAAANEQNVIYSSSAYIKGWDTTGTAAAPAQYGNMVLISEDGLSEIAVYGSSATASVFTFDKVTGTYTYTNARDFLTNATTEQLGLGYKVNFYGIRKDYNTTKQINIVITGFVSTTDQALVVANDIMTGEGLNAETNCAIVYASLTAKYNALNTQAKAVFDTSAVEVFVNARARMAYLQAWVAANEAPAGRPTTTPILNNVAAIVLIGAIGLTTIVGYYFLNKKKLSA